MTIKIDSQDGDVFYHMWAAYLLKTNILKIINHLEMYNSYDHIGSGEINVPLPPDIWEYLDELTEIVIDLRNKNGYLALQLEYIIQEKYGLALIMLYGGVPQWLNCPRHSP